MVVFTCNSCGSTLKKNQVERHMGSCGHVVSCIDCLKDFNGNEFQAHTKCISEAEKYNGPGWKPPSSQNKGERKQMAWVETVNAALEKGRQRLTPSQIALLKLISKHDNVPRKKAKFMNFIKNVARNFDMSTVEAVWDSIEAEWKAQAEQSKPADKPAEPEVGAPSNGSTDQNGQSTENGEDVSRKKKSKKDKKKRKRECDDEVPEENVHIKRKKESGEQNEPNETENENSMVIDSSGNFSWGELIEKILLSKKDHSIAMNRLRKKLFSEYYAIVGDSKGVKTKEDLICQLNKKLKKNKRFRVVGDIVRLAANR